MVAEASVLLWNKTEGLCGTLDGNPENDLTTKEKTIALTKSVMIASWELNKIGGRNVKKDIQLGSKLLK